ncbi:tetratricopeptide repeat protein [Candidatus Sumerlaeota bacterium]|nr:tetratricopeptide repeat protein [Candidatus Sumerlaeota bacterium]
MISTKSIISFVVIFMALIISVPAMYMRREIIRVPVTRLTENLEKKIQEEPKNAQFRYQLARVYSMAFALKSEELQAARTDAGELEVDYGNGPSSELPPRVQVSGSATTETKDPERRKQVNQWLYWLSKAIESYEKAIELGKDDAAVRLGLGWCLERRGEKEKAKEQYRKALDLAWNKEKALPMVFETSMTVETANYLKKLLHPERDSKELAEINYKVKAMDRVAIAVTPLLVPLRSGLSLEGLVAPSARVKFDLDGSGVMREWGWITPDAAWLVFVGNGGEIIDSGRQMFGGFTFMIFWQTGYDALGSLDDDGDGELQGTELHGIALWHDANSNGACEPDEIESLSSYGIVALSCHHQPHTSGIPFNPAGCALEDGTTRATYDWMAPSPGSN